MGRVVGMEGVPMVPVRVTIEKPTASGRRVGWWKRVTGVDRSKKGGWALEGDFLDEGEQDFKVGNVLVCATPRGSARHGRKGLTVYVVTPQGLNTVRGEGCDDDGEFNLGRQTPSICDAIELAFDLWREDTVSPLAEFSTEDLLAELARRGVAP